MTSRRRTRLAHRDWRQRRCKGTRKEYISRHPQVCRWVLCSCGIDAGTRRGGREVWLERHHDRSAVIHALTP